MNSLFTKLIYHYQGLVEESTSLRVFYEGELNKAKACNDFKRQKLCIKLLSEIKAIQIEHREGLLYWREAEKNYLEGKYKK